MIYGLRSSFQIILFPCLAPGPVPQGRNEQDGEQVRLLERNLLTILLSQGSASEEDLYFQRFMLVSQIWSGFPRHFPVTSFTLQSGCLLSHSHNSLMHKSTVIITQSGTIFVTLPVTFTRRSHATLEEKRRKQICI